MGEATVRGKAKRRFRLGGKKVREPAAHARKLPNNPLYDIRLRNLLGLIKESFDDNKAAFARAIARSEAYIWQMLNGHRKIGEVMARYVETTLHLDAMVLDKSQGAIFGPTKLLVVHIGDGEVVKYHMVHERRLDNLNEPLEGPEGRMTLPCPLGGSEETIFFRVDSNALEPIAREGEIGFLDRGKQARELENGVLYACKTPASGRRAVVLRCLLDQQFRFYSPSVTFPREDTKSWSAKEVKVKGRVIAWQRKA